MGRTGILLLVGAAWLAAAACSEDVTPPPPAAPADPIDVAIVAANIAFDPPAAVVPAGIPLRITLDNRDFNVPHNVQLLAGPRLRGGPGEDGDRQRAPPRRQP